MKYTNRTRVSKKSAAMNDRTTKVSRYKRRYAESFSFLTKTSTTCTSQWSKNRVMKKKSMSKFQYE